MVSPVFFFSMEPLPLPMDAEEIVSAVTRGDISIDNVVEDSLTRCAAVQENLIPLQPSMPMKPGKMPVQPQHG